MKSKVMVANPCKTCNGTGKVPERARSEPTDPGAEHFIQFCNDCKGEGKCYEWTTIEDIFAFVNTTIHYRMRARIPAREDAI